MNNNNNNNYNNTYHANDNCRNKDENTTCTSLQCCRGLIGTGSQGCGGNTERYVKLGKYLRSQTNAPTRPQKSTVAAEDATLTKRCSGSSSICDFLRSGAPPEWTKQAGQQKPQADVKGGVDRWKETVTAAVAAANVNKGKSNAKGGVDRWKNTVTAAVAAAAVNVAKSADVDTVKRTTDNNCVSADQQSNNHIVTIVIDVWRDSSTVTVTKNPAETNGTDPGCPIVLYKETLDGRRQSPCAKDRRVTSRSRADECATPARCERQRPVAVPHSAAAEATCTTHAQTDRYSDETRTIRSRPLRSSCERLRVMSRDSVDERVANPPSYYPTRTPLPWTDDETSAPT